MSLLVKVATFIFNTLIMEKEQKKQLMKYLCFLFMGVILGYIVGQCSNTHVATDKEITLEEDVNLNDTVYSVDTWYGTYSVSDTIANETFIP